MTNIAAKNIESPCIRNCCLDKNDICMGCYRTLSEIIGWYEANRSEREIILLSAKIRSEASGSKHDQLQETRL